MTPKEIEQLKKAVPFMPQLEQLETLSLLEELETRRIRQDSQDKFIDFVKQMWPEFISGRHHAKMAEAFERVARGETKRLIVNMPPRS